MSLLHTGKVPVVTGSSRSIAAAIATRLASQGANVVINYVSKAKAAQGVANAINAKGAGKAMMIQADVSSLTHIKRLVAETLAQLGRIDIIVLNASIMEFKTLSQGTEESFDRHLNSNVKGPLFLMKEAAPHLKEGSSIIVTASAIVPNYLLYASTKGTTEQLFRTLAKELGAKGITVNSIAPSPIETGMFRQDKTEQQINFFAGLHPQKRLGQPEEVSNVVAFLVSQEASWVNGQTLRVNGGFVV
ncbi:NAD-P-binding protein [Daedaleopsis nitida]|nr:NAD-P-binding protein [Daedaleopsis nitida]